MDIVIHKKASAIRLYNLVGGVVVDGSRFTPLHFLKQPPGRPSPAAMLRLTTKLERIQETEVLSIDLSWLNNNYQRSLARYAQQRSANRLKQLQQGRRYAVLTCFLHQSCADTIDFLIEMHDKLQMLFQQIDKSLLEKQVGEVDKCLTNNPRSIILFSVIL